MRTVLVVSIVILCAGCGGHDGVTTPTALTAAFGLIGSVTDSAGNPLAQARVEVTDSSQKGVAAVTDSTGAFAFGPIFTSEFTLRASKEGHRDQSKVISTAQSDAVFKLELDLRGSYDITFAAAAACTNLPAAARSRTYSASFGSSGPPGTSSYLGTLGNADFGRGSAQSYPSWNVVYVNASADVGHIYFSDPEIWEHLTRGTDVSPGTDLVILGDATGILREDTSRWSFAGTFTYCPAAAFDDYPRCAVPEISCPSRDHQLTLTRR